MFLNFCNLTNIKSEGLGDETDEVNLSSRFGLWGYLVSMCRDLRDGIEIVVLAIEAGVVVWLGKVEIRGGSQNGHFSFVNPADQPLFRSSENWD